MASRRGKPTGTASEAGAAAPRVSAASVKGAPPEPSESPAGPEAARPSARRRGPSRASGSRREKSGSDLPEKPQVRARAARAEDQAEGPAARTGEVEPPAAQGPLLPRAGSRREGTARSARERRPQPGPVEVPGPGPLVPVPGLGRGEEAPGAWKPRRVLHRLRLSRQEISAAAEVVNRIVDHLLRRLQSCESEFKAVALLRTGSYYERVKISAPNEFDVMFKLELPRIQLEEYHNSGAHYFVKFKRNPRGNPLDQFLEGEILSASKMLFKFRKIIKEEIKNIEDTDVIVEKKRRGSPAVTLLIRKPKEISVDVILALEAKGSWPASTQGGLPISNWLGAKVRNDLRRQPFYLVPKHAKEGSGFQEETWRLSFSHIEKDILKNHGKSKTCCEIDGVKCCRKECLKLMKYLLEQLKKKFENRKELDKFCSYHVKTAFFHVCAQDPDDSHWHSKNLELCFDHCVTYFLQCLKTEQLEHYFIPEVNLFSRDHIDKISKEFLSKQIECERNNGFPVFGEF
ncbi:cyclic GMP-AMP synthase [Hippopotamus amphibius kiboko]|uniref:cyclic GMP-AMP synthase n=1 Tax=Hippopotamus amphibius kiboko TaxID=575201 RepID=UPI002597867C|nr:cyclic GMP-AMP synthase [Hippopotamus amphibius kiboko]